MKNIFTFIVTILQILSVFISGEKVSESTASLPVIMYHHISEKGNLLGDYVITPEEFESDMQYLQANGYQAVLPSEIAGGELPEKPIMITFDDGFLSTYKYALPILQKYSMKAVCAVVGALVQEYTDTPNTVSDCAYMDKNTVKALADSNVFEIACHTYNMHAIGARKGCAKMKNENAAEYRAVLTQDTNKFNELFRSVMNCDTNIMAFPYGEYNAETIEIASDCGYNIFLTCDERVNKIDTQDIKYPLVLGRFNRIHGITSEDFFNKMNMPVLLLVGFEELSHAVAGLR